ncbi:NAD-dependent epimerase/dehydratase family protein [Streptomyces albidoflavus]|uniref:NAD-dependent epimerase/dehydratase family protein n=1 Tax=Streptomyces albidoflavus TaxID=1886 RepID=UPI003D0C8BC1
MRRLLVLGGTEFVGRAVVEAALTGGWEVDLLHRGRHPAPAGARALLGDRTAPGGLDALARAAAEGPGWDLVVDTWSGAPSVVRDSAALLAPYAGRYAYVSSRSVYGPPVARGADESAPVVAGDPDAAARSYAEDKRGGELAAARAFGEERTLWARAGLILGPWENIGRLPWWLTRIARGGEVPAPGPRDLPVQYIDARDLADWLLAAGRAGLHGAYDLVSPAGFTTMGELLDTCVTVTGSTADLRWLTPEAVLAAGAEPWLELPVWIPPDTPDHAALHGSDVSKALAAGLRCRPVAETVRDTWAWLATLPGRVAPQRPDRPVVGLPEEKEAALLGRGQGVQT